MDSPLITPEEIKRLVNGALHGDPSAETELEAFRVILQQRQVVALERIADGFDKPCNHYGETAVEAIGANIARALAGQS